MLLGKRSAAWDHTSLLLLTMHQALGNKTITLERLHPYASSAQSQKEKKQAFRQYNKEVHRKNKQ